MPETLENSAMEPPADARERILLVAARLFAERGFEGASTAAIAKAAGVTQPLIHYYFSTKERLWQATVDLFCERLKLIDQNFLLELRDLDTLSQLKVIARRFVQFIRQCPELARLLSHEAMRGGPRFSYIADSLVRPMLSVLDSAVSKAQRDGWLKPVPVEHLFFLWLGAASQLFAAPALANELGLDPDAPATAQQFSDAYVEIVFHGLARPERLDPDSPQSPARGEEQP